MTDKELNTVLKHIDENTELKSDLRSHIKLNFAIVIARLNRIETYNGDKG